MRIFYRTVLKSYLIYFKKKKKRLPYSDLIRRYKNYIIGVYNLNPK